MRSVPGPPEVHRLSDRELDAHLRNLTTTLSGLEQQGARAEALRASARHPVWQVRSRVLDLASSWLPMSE